MTGGVGEDIELGGAADAGGQRDHMRVNKGRCWVLRLGHVNPGWTDGRGTRWTRRITES